jgi:hypothetical protein
MIWLKCFNRFFEIGSVYTSFACFNIVEMYFCQNIFKYSRIKFVISRYNKHHKTIDTKYTAYRYECLNSDCKTLHKLFCISIPCVSGVYDVNENNQDFNENIVVVVHLMQITRKICRI